MSLLDSYVLETTLTLGVVVAIAVALLYGARKLGAGRASGPMTIAGVLPLDGRRSIYLVRIGARVLVVGVSEAGMASLGELNAADLG